MRCVAVLLVLGSAVEGLAQETPPPAYGDPYAPSASASVEPPAATASLALPASSERVVRAPLPHSTVVAWRGARTMNVFGGVIGLLSTGLSLSSAIYVAATHYPPSASDLFYSPKPSDTGPLLSYVASSASALGFMLSAGGLAWRHHILHELGADPGRGYFIGGTVVGVIGLVGVAAGYFFGFTSYLNPHDQSIAVLAASLSGSALCGVGSGLYAKDSSRLTRAWKSMTTF